MMTRERGAVAAAGRGTTPSRGGKCRAGRYDFPAASNGFTFGAIVEVVYGLPLEERLDLKNLLERNIIEARRDEIARNGQEAHRAEKNNELAFSDNIETLRKML